MDYGDDLGDNNNDPARKLLSGKTTLITFKLFPWTASTATTCIPHVFWAQIHQTPALWTMTNHRFGISFRTHTFIDDNPSLFLSGSVMHHWFGITFVSLEKLSHCENTYFTHTFHKCCWIFFVPFVMMISICFPPIWNHPSSGCFVVLSGHTDICLNVGYFLPIFALPIDFAFIPLFGICVKQLYY